MILAIEICLGVPLQSVQLFLPQIVGRLGYSTVKTNLYTVAPNIGGAVMLLLLAFASDHVRWRFPFVVSERRGYDGWESRMVDLWTLTHSQALGFLFTFLGMVVYAGIDVEKQVKVAYFATFMMTWYVDPRPPGLCPKCVSEQGSSASADSCQGNIGTFGAVGCLV